VEFEQTTIFLDPWLTTLVKTRHDIIRHGDIRVKVGVPHLVENMVETKLGWFGHAKRRPIVFVERRVYQIKGSQITKGRGILRKTIRETIKKDLEINELDRDVIYNRILWRRLIHVAEPT
jgi:hypothetical protein